jgi:phosphoribosylamine--glycine ligase
MRILVVGSGGREHALCWKLADSPLCDQLYCAPGNAGIAEIAQCAPIDAMDIDGLLDFARRERIDLTVIGPEAPLVAGIADRFRAAGMAIFGPGASAAEIEGSKGFMKDLANRLGVPTARYGRFASAAQARDFAAAMKPPIVVKADGLAAGKGVIICHDHEAAARAIESMLVESAFGAAGASVVIEEFLDGEELSFFALCDGDHALALGSAQDHKQVGEGDTGPNTGGMGAYSPAPIATPAIETEIMERIVRPTITGLRAMGRPFVGVLFAGVMVTREGVKLIEFNARFGDPECEVLCLRLKSDLLPALIAACDGSLNEFDLRWRDEAAVCVVLATKGYPGKLDAPSVIDGLDGIAKTLGVTVFHAATKRDASNRLVSSGGRVLAVCALGSDVGQARDRAYEAIDRIAWPGGFCRRDIAWRAIERSNRERS